MNMTSAVHYVQMGLAGLVQGALVLAVAEPALAHYALISCVVLVAVLSPLGLASPSMLQVNPALTGALGAPPAPAPAIGFTAPATPPSTL